MRAARQSVPIPIYQRLRPPITSEQWRAARGDHRGLLCAQFKRWLCSSKMGAPGNSSAPCEQFLCENVPWGDVLPTFLGFGAVTLFLTLASLKALSKASDPLPRTGRTSAAQRSDGVASS